MAAAPGFTTTLQTVHLERGIKIVDSPGVIFDDDPPGGDKPLEGSQTTLHLRNILRPEDFDDPIAVGTLGFHNPLRPLLNYRSLFLVEEILARVDATTIQKIYNLPPSGGELGAGSTLEFLTMLSLTSGRLLKVSPSPMSVQISCG